MVSLLFNTSVLYKNSTSHFYVNLAQATVIYKVGTSIEKRSP